PSSTPTVPATTWVIVSRKRDCRPGQYVFSDLVGRFFSDVLTYFTAYSMPLSASGEYRALSTPSKCVFMSDGRVLSRYGRSELARIGVQTPLKTWMSWARLLRSFHSAPMAFFSAGVNSTHQPLSLRPLLVMPGSPSHTNLAT